MGQSSQAQPTLRSQQALPVLPQDHQHLGSTGKISLLREYIHPKRALRPSQATVRYETDAGYQLQHDWGELAVEVGGELRKVYISVNTLGYSRRFFVYAAYSNDAARTYESLVQSVNWFGLGDPVAFRVK